MGKKKEKVKILFAVSEVAPFLTTGGMGQVAGGLTAALSKKEFDLDVRLVMPLYSHFRDKYETQMRFLGKVYLQLAWRNIYCGVFTLEQNGVTYYFVDNRHYFGRDNAYGYFDDGERFAFFSKAVFTVMEIADFVPDVIHAHDWQSALVPVYLKTRFLNKYPDMRTVFTLHNMEYQGKYSKYILNDIFDLWNEELGLVEFDGCINLLKGAIVCADRLTTVSPSYAKEIQYGGGYGLDALISENAYKLSGIINGIDTEVYDPSADPFIEKRYTADSLENKAVNKKKLQTLFDLPVRDSTMLICVVSRLVSHKGIDLITYMMDDLLKLDVQFLLLGTGDHHFELFFEELATSRSDKVGVNIAFNPEIASKIYAGADVMLMPSYSEPCGLAQMIACRYGTVPIVRKTGGLGDTIRDCRAGNGNGFLFTGNNSDALYDTVYQALALYTNSKEDWLNLMREGMACDFSWDISAKAYSTLYKELLEV